MATKYTTTLSADTSQHDAALKKSASEIYKYNKKVDDTKKSLNSFTGQIGKMGGTLGSFGGKLNGVMGIFSKLNPVVLGATTAIGGVAAVVRSNETTMDKWKSNVEGIKNAYQSLLSTLNTGDWGSVWDNFFNALNRGRDAYNAADAFDTYTAFNSVELKRISNEILDIQNQMYEAQREGRDKDLKSLQSQLKEKNNLYKQELAKEKKLAENNANTQLLKVINTKYGFLNGFDVEQYAKKYLTSGAGFEELQRLYNEKKAAGLSDNATSFMYFASQAIQKEAKLRAEGGYIEQINKVQDYDIAIQNAEKSLNKFLKMQVSVSKAPTIKTPKTIAEAKTEEDVKDLLGEKRQQLENLKRLLTNNMVLFRYGGNISSEILEMLREQNGDLTTQILNLKNEIENIEDAYNDILGFKKKIDTPYYADDSLTALELELENRIQSRDSYIRSNDVDLVKLYNIKIKELEEQIKNKKIELGLIDPDKVEEQVEEIKYTIVDAYSEIMNLYSNITTLGSTLGDVFDSDELKEFFDTLNKGLSVIQAVYSVFESINKVMEISNALKAVSNKLTEEGTAAAVADTAAQTTDASANASNAIAGATKSGAKLPYPMNLIAIATGIAAVVGALSLMGSFADGGIVGGNTTVGDHGLARVNAGEMILNKREQTRLWHNLNGMGNINNGVSGDVVFKISGSDLVGTINNYNNKNRRVR